MRLIAVADLPPSGVVAIDTPRGRLAVGIANGEPFAVSDRCRHMFASLGEGRVSDDGCLECPLHGARYDVVSGRMTRGPQGRLFAPASGVVRRYTNAAFRLERHSVVERDGALHLE